MIFSSAVDPVTSLMRWGILTFALCCTACGFNRTYLHPTTIPINAKGATLSSKWDTTRVQFQGDIRQPVFYSGKGDTLKRDFTVESTWFTTSGGHKLNGWMIRPTGMKPDITLLHFHGNAGCLLSQYQALVPLVEKGFQVFAFDYSGFGMSEGEATREQVLLDGRAAVDYVRSRPDVNGTRLVLYGQSLGGHLAAVVGPEKSTSLDALVIEGAFSSHDDIAAEKMGFIGRLLVREQYSGKAAIGQWTKRLLVIHSTEDEVIPFRLGRELFDHAHEPKSFFEIRHPHICGPEFYADEIAQRIRAMVNQAN